MQLIVQRVLSAEVVFEDGVLISIGNGFLLYICFHPDDNEKVVTNAATKLKKLQFLRVGEIPDQEDLLIISNFTILAKPKRNKFSYHCAMKKTDAEVLFNKFIEEIKKIHQKTETPGFGAEIHVKSTVEGPLNVLLEFRAPKVESKDKKE